MPGRLHRATFGRLFAAGYDAGMARSEDAGLRARRQALLAHARGATLELGAGTGANLDHYPAAVGELLLAEPGPHMRARLLRRLDRRERGVRVVAAPAEALPVPDASVDTVVSTLVLCTVPDVDAALREVARVLRPGGRLLVLEHVRAAEGSRARVQDLVTPLWRILADGCHPNRDILAALEASPLAVEAVEHGRLPKASGIVEPLLIARARRS